MRNTTPAYGSPILNHRRYLLTFLIVFLSPQLAAAPSGQQLLNACETALANGYRGLPASMCEWYVTPCDCDAGTKVEKPRVCLPAGISSKVLARKVIAGIKAEPELAGKSAAYSAARILSRSYPCNK